MQDIDVEEALVQKVGGKFRLTALIQKRMVELNRGADPLIEVDDDFKTVRQVVIEEILQGKIELAPFEELGAALEEGKAAVEPVREVPAPRPAEKQEEAEDVEIYGSDIKKIKEQRIKELSQLLNPKK